MTESREQRAGSDCVLLRLSELMFVEMLRRYLAGLPPEETGWLAALRDPTVGRALRLLHQEPGRAWTVDELARQAGLSRSALSERFTQLLGLAPIQYLTRWRMQKAAGLLREGQASLAEIAEQVGYDSEAAFSKAFKRAIGSAPGAYRRAARDSASVAA